MRDRNEIVLVLLLVLGLAAGCQPAPMDAAAGAWPPGGQRLVRPCQDAAADLGAWLSTLADDPARAEPPAASAIDGQLRAIAEQADADSAVELVRLAAVLVQDCPQVEAAFRETLQTPRAERARILAERAAPALASCGCSLDLSAMKALLWTYVTGRQPDVGLAAASDLRDWVVALESSQQTLAPPAASSIDGELLRLAMDADRELTSGLVDLGERVLASCPAALEVFDRAAGSAAVERPAILARALPSALQEPGCQAGRAEVAALVWTLLQAEAPRHQPGPASLPTH